MMNSRGPFVGLCCVGVVLGVAVLGGCQGTSRARSTVPPSATAAQVAEARQAAIVAAESASKARLARERGKDSEAIRLSKTAIEQYRRSLSLSAESPEVWNNLGVELMQVEDYLGASESFSMAMQLSPTDPRPAENLGLVYQRTGWTEESLRFYDMALERSPNYLPALRGAIKASHLLGEADERRLAQVRRALMIETDPTLREFFEREQVRILGRIERTDRRR